MERLPSLSLSRWRWMRLRSPSGVKRGSRKHDRPPVGLGEDEERVAHRRREEPLVPGDLVLAARPAAVQRPGGGGVGAHVGAALLLGHAHPAQRPLLVRRGDEPLAVVGQRQEARLPLGRQLGLRSQRRDHRVGHRDRAAHPRLDLAEEHEQRAARDVGARLRVAPRQTRAGRGRSRSASARARRGGTRPRRSGCRSGRGCGASAGSGSPRRPSGSSAAARRGRPARGPRPRPNRLPRGAAPRPAPCPRRTRCSPPAAEAG